MTRENIIDFINEIEEKLPIYDWKIKDLHIWPFLRIKIAFHFYNLQFNLKQEKKTTPSRYKKFFSYRINGLRKNLLGLIQYINLLYIRDFKDGYFFISLNQVRANINDIWVDRFIDYFIDYLRTSKKKCLIFESNTISNIGKKKLNSDINFDESNLLYFYSRLKKVKIGDDDLKLERYEQLIEFLIEQGHSDLAKKISIPLVVRQAGEVLVSKSLYKKLLIRHKPKKLFEVSYYSDRVMAWNEAAASLGIPTIEFQHGFQGKYHASYGGWKNFPSHGYDSLPNIFWNWDKNSVQIIESNFNSPKHQAYLGGNQWMESWKDKKWLQNFYRGVIPIVKDENIILYSLQPINDLFPEFLIEAIHKTSKNFKWWIRLHPRQLDIKDALVLELKEKKIFNLVNIEDATNFPLPLILPNTFIHITNWSSVVMEGFSFNIPSIIINKVGFEYFKDFEEKKLLYFYNPSSPLDKLIYEIKERFNNDLLLNKMDVLTKFEGILNKKINDQ